MHAPLHTDRYTALKPNNSAQTFSAMNPVATEYVDKKHMAGGKLYPTIQTKNCHFVWSELEHKWGTNEDKSECMTCVLCILQLAKRHLSAQSVIKHKPIALYAWLKASVRNLFKNSIEMHWKGLGVTLMALLGLAIPRTYLQFLCMNMFRNQFVVSTVNICSSQTGMKQYLTPNHCVHVPRSYDYHEAVLVVNGTLYTP